MPADITRYSQSIIRGASFSRCGRYRYRLWRRWSGGNGRCVFIGLNPSIADAKRDDPTIRRCTAFARDWGYQELVMVNLFAYCATDPRDLKQAEDAIKPYNRRVVLEACRSAKRVVAAWGIHGQHLGQGQNMLDALADVSVDCFGLTRCGQPLHPLYQRRTAGLVPFA